MQAAVDFNNSIKNFLGRSQLTLNSRCWPPTARQDFCAELVVDFIRQNGELPNDLLIFRALLIHGKAVGQKRLVWRMAINRSAGKQRGMEPAAMLIKDLQDDTDRRADLPAWPSLCEPRSNMPVRGARIELVHTSSVSFES